MRVLVLNSGSSSVMYQLVDSDTGERLAGGVVEEVVGDRRPDDLRDDLAADFFLGHVGAMLGRDDDGVNPLRCVPFVFDRHLALAIRP